MQRLVQQAELASAIRLAQDFAQLVRQKQSAQFELWLERAEQSQLAPFECFARSLKEDYDPVKAGVTLETSTGQVEGQINRLKMIKNVWTSIRRRRHWRVTTDADPSTPPIASCRGSSDQISKLSLLRLLASSDCRRHYAIAFSQAGVVAVVPAKMTVI